MSFKKCFSKEDARAMAYESQYKGLCKTHIF